MPLFPSVLLAEMLMLVVLIWLAGDEKYCPLAGLAISFVNNFEIMRLCLCGVYVLVLIGMYVYEKILLCRYA